MFFLDRNSRLNEHLSFSLQPCLPVPLRRFAQTRCLPRFLIRNFSSESAQHWGKREFNSNASWFRQSWDFSMEINLQEQDMNHFYDTIITRKSIDVNWRRELNNYPFKLISSYKMEVMIDSIINKIRTFRRRFVFLVLRFRKPLTLNLLFIQLTLKTKIPIILCFSLGIVNKG